MMTTGQQGEVHQMDDTIVTDEDAEVLAQRAAAATRDLNHAVQPAKGELTYPADVYKILGSLEALAGWLPQASGQLARWLGSQAEAGRLRATDCGPFSDVPAAVAAAGAAALRTRRAWRPASGFWPVANGCGAAPSGHDQAASRAWR